MTGIEPPPDRAHAWTGYLVAAGCLVWVFHGIRWPDLFVFAKTINWGLLSLAIAADIAGYVTQGARWSLLLRPVGRLSTFKATHAIYAGLFTNEVLPLRVGELLRGYLVSRWTSLSITKIFSSILAERVLDGLWLVLAAGVVVLAAPLPSYLVHAEEILAVAILAATAVFIHLVTRKERALECEDTARVAGSPGLTSRLTRMIQHVAETLRSIGTAPSFYGAVGLSGLLLALFTVSFWCVMEACGLGLSLWQGGAVFLIMHIGTVIPGAPSNIGTYQFFTVLGLTLFGVDKTAATGFSLIVFLILTAPLWIIGFFAFGRAQLNSRTVRAEISKLAGAVRGI